MAAWKLFLAQGSSSGLIQYLMVMVSLVNVDWATFKELEEAGLAQPTGLLQLVL